MTDLEELKRRAALAVDALAPELVALSDDLHAHPELKFEEHHAAAQATALLARHGREPELGVGGLATAFAARLPSNEGPTLALLSEYDALPGLGHACGHNVICAAGVGAFLALARLGPLPGTVRLVGTPGEEGGGGKIDLLDAGVFEGVDAAFMIHPFDRTYAHVSLAGRTPLRLTFEGRASHAAASPEAGINALDAAVLFFNATNALRQRLEPTARLHGIITHGGDAPNIIPDRVVVEYYARAEVPSVLDRLEAEVRACAEGAALQVGGTVAIERSAKRYDSFESHRPLSEAFARNLDALGAPREPGDCRIMASSDIGNLSQHFPCIHPYLGMGEGLVCHTPAFADASGDERGRRVLVAGAKALAMTVLDALFEPSLTARP